MPSFFVEYVDLTMAVITMYTDGSALGNPGPGGYGVVLMSGPYRKELSCGYAHTTNNRMELMAVIVGLEALKNDGCEVTIYMWSMLSRRVGSSAGRRRVLRIRKIPICGDDSWLCTVGIMSVSCGLRGMPKSPKTNVVTVWR